MSGPESSSPREPQAFTPFCTPVAATNPCGCRIVGMGTGPDPLRIYWCERHAVINDVRETAPLVRDAGAMHESAKARSVVAEAALLSAMINEVRDALPAVVGPPGSRDAGWRLLIGQRLLGRLGLAIDDEGCLHSVASDGYDGDREMVHLELVSAETAVTTHGLHAILDALADVLDSSLGQKKAADRIEKRIAIVQAVTLLLRKGEKS